MQIEGNRRFFLSFLALKKTHDLKPSEKEGIPLTTLKEIEFRRRLRHRNVIRLIDMKEDVDKHKRPVQYLVYEYMESDLNKYMDFQLNELNIDIPPMMIHKLMYQLLSGLAYCHKKQAMHRSDYIHLIRSERCQNLFVLFLFLDIAGI